MIDINKIKKDLINYGALKVYEYDVDWVQEEEEDPVVLNNAQLVDIMANRYDVVKVNINLISREEGEPDSVSIIKSVFVRTLYVDQDNTKMLIYTQSPDDDGTLTQIIISCVNGSYSYQMVDTDIGGGGGGGGGFEVPTFTPTTFEVDLPDVDISLSARDCADVIKNKYPLINVAADLGGGESVSLTFVCNNVLNGVDKGEPFTQIQYVLIADDDENIYEIGLNFASNESINKSWGTTISGGAAIEYATNNDVDTLFNDEPGEDIPVESIGFVNLPEDHSIELNVGDVVDMSQYIEVSPSDATDKSYTLTTDAPSVLSINGTTITVLQGAEGLNANLTVTANDGSGCNDIMIVDILNGEEPEPEVPIESLRYTDGQGNTCVGFGMLEGESVDLWTNLEITPSDATEGVEFTSDDDGIIEVDGTGIATATGVAGESTTITMSSMENPNIYTTVEISINVEDDEEEGE